MRSPAFFTMSEDLFQDPKTKTQVSVDRNAGRDGKSTLQAPLLNSVASGEEVFVEDVTPSAGSLISNHSDVSLPEIPSNGGAAGGAVDPAAEGADANKMPNNTNLNDKYDTFCWVLFYLYFFSEIITFIWRSSRDKEDHTYFVLMIIQAGINFALFVSYIYLLCSCNGPLFVVTSHHVFTFFPFLALMAANTVVVRTEQGWSWLQLVIDLFGYLILQIIAGLSLGKSNLVYPTMVCIFTAVFVLMIVVVLAKHESELSPSLEFIKGVIEQILVLELFHLAFQKLMMDKDARNEMKKKSPPK
jgi:hypothetical protein